MSKMHFHYIVPGDDFTRAGEASSSVKKKLKQLGYDPDATRRVAIAMYEGCLLYTSPSPRDRTRSRMPSSA